MSTSRLTAQPESCLCMSYCSSYHNVLLFNKKNPFFQRNAWRYLMLATTVMWITEIRILFSHLCIKHTKKGGGPSTHKEFYEYTGDRRPIHDRATGQVALTRKATGPQNTTGILGRDGVKAKVWEGQGWPAGLVWQPALAAEAWARHLDLCQSGQSYWSTFKFSTHKSYRGEHHVCIREKIKHFIRAKLEFLLLDYLRIKVAVSKNSTLGSYGPLKMTPNSLRFKASVTWCPWARGLQVLCPANLPKLPVGPHWPRAQGMLACKQMPDSARWCWRSGYSRNGHIIPQGQDLPGALLVRGTAGWAIQPTPLPPPTLWLWEAHPSSSSAVTPAWWGPMRWPCIPLHPRQGLSRLWPSSDEWNLRAGACTTWERLPEP